MLKRTGSDLLLIDLAKTALESISWPTEVQTGRLMFELGDVIRNTADVRIVESDSGDGKRSAQRQKSGMIPEIHVAHICSNSLIEFPMCSRLL